MASAFAHALFAVTIGNTYARKYFTLKFWLLGMVCSILPDADVVMFRIGIPYEHFLGHRGFSHSLVFSLLIGVLVIKLFYRQVKLLQKEGIMLVLLFFLCTASHILLDAMTSGGLGVAVFSPFNNARYFLPWRPIQVSPIGVEAFFSSWGLRVIKSELLWIGLPCLLFLLLMIFRRKTKAVEIRSRVK